MTGPSLAGRAALAVGLMIGFYLLAFAIVGGLLFFVYAEVVYLEHVNFKLTLLAIVGAGAILWAILPRIDRFEPPGPELRPDAHPRLFDDLRAVAGATSQTMPREVYLVPDLNAWVAQRGGIMGFASRRVMGIGLPLLETLTVGQLRAVIAHEFGHYHGGDTALGPWIYRTRAAIGRTLETLEQHAALLVFPFMWYGKTFLRITHAISRRQEFAADALAARTAGAGAISDALRSIHATGAAFAPYWSMEVIPAIQSGVRPPIASGFRRFLAAPQIARSVAEGVERELSEGVADPYDTHPPLRERLAALTSSAERPTLAPDDRPATALLDDVAALEVTLVDHLLRPEARGTLTAVQWEEVGTRVWVPTWREQARAFSRNLENLLPPAIAGYAGDLPRFVADTGLARSKDAVTPELIAQTLHAVGAAIATALHDRGFATHALPGEPVTMARDGLTVAPFEVLKDVLNGTLSAEEWKERCSAAGIADVDLGTVAASGVRADGTLPGPGAERSALSGPQS